MAKIVAIHGINQAYRGRHVITSEWLPALKDGLERAGGSLESDDDLYCGFYGHLFRNTRGGIPDFNHRDLQTDWEKEFLIALWQQALQTDPTLSMMGEVSHQRASTPQAIQQILRFLSRLLGWGAERVIIFFIKQVEAYLYNPAIRDQIRGSVTECIQSDTRVLIGHSLGSIACYESLCLHPEWPIDTFISLGSPLGIQRLIFDQLEPAPIDGQGQWPGSVKNWVNIADAGDLVALEKRLDPFFTGSVDDQSIDNGADAHRATIYLTSGVTGAAIKRGLEN